MYRGIKLCIDAEHQLAEFRQARMLRDAGTGNEENVAARMCKK